MTELSGELDAMRETFVTGRALIEVCYGWTHVTFCASANQAGAPHSGHAGHAKASRPGVVKPA